MSSDTQQLSKTSSRSQLLSGREKITSQQTRHIAQLANIPITNSEAESLTQGFKKTLDVINKLQSIDTNGVEPTHQVTGLENILREDTVDNSRTFTQQEALANINQTHNGYFVVPRIIEKNA